jgi:hypothetical protein
MSRRVVFLLCAVFALTIGVATAHAGGGNSANAKLCQQGGWQIRYNANENSFPSEQACVGYAAHGGSIRFLTLSTDLVACPAPSSDELCFGAITGQGLKPSPNLGDNVVSVVISFISDGQVHEIINRPVDANGNIAFPVQLFCGDLPGLTATAHSMMPSGAIITSNTISPLPC